MDSKTLNEYKQYLISQGNNPDQVNAYVQYLSEQNNISLLPEEKQQDFRKQLQPQETGNPLTSENETTTSPIQALKRLANPDLAYSPEQLAEKEDLKSYVAGGAQNRSIGLIDEARGAVKNPKGAAKALADYFFIDDALGEDWSRKSSDPDVQEYEQTAQQARQEYDQAYAHSPKRFIMGGVGSGFMGGPNPLPKNVTQSVGMGAGMGATSSGGDNIKEDLANIAIGGAIGGVADLGLRALKWLGNKVIPMKEAKDAYELGKKGINVNAPDALDQAKDKLLNKDQEIIDFITTNKKEASNAIGELLGKVKTDSVDADDYVNKLLQIKDGVSKAPKVMEADDGLRTIFISNIDDEISRVAPHRVQTGPNLPANTNVEGVHNFKKLADDIVTGNEDKFSSRVFKEGKKVQKLARDTVSNAFEGADKQNWANQNSRFAAASAAAEKYLQDDVAAKFDPNLKNRIINTLKSLYSDADSSIIAQKEFQELTRDLKAIDPNAAEKLIDSMIESSKQFKTAKDVTNFLHNLNVFRISERGSVGVANALGRQKIPSIVIDTYSKMMSELERKGIRPSPEEQNRVLNSLLKQFGYLKEDVDTGEVKNGR